MRNASQASESDRDEMRATFVVRRSLVREFRALAHRRNRNLSAELRQLMQEAVDRDREERAA